MKRQFIGWTLMMVLLLVAAGCSDDNSLKSIQKVGNGQVYTITCTLPQIGDNTRAKLDSDGVTPVWEEDDEIALNVDGNDTIIAKLSSGAGTNAGTFTYDYTIGTGNKIYAYYPCKVNEEYDLSSQTGLDVKKMAMYATCAISDYQVMKFKNKSSILKLEIPVPDGFNKESTNIKTTVIGAYNKGNLNQYGNWTNLSVGNIEVQTTKIVDDKLTAYVVVIPGSKVFDLRFEVSDGTNLYCTSTYANLTATIQENQLITISKQLTKVLEWYDGITSDEVVNAITVPTSRTRATTDSYGTLIVAKEIDLSNDNTIQKGLAKYKSTTGKNVNLTLLDQKEIYYSSFNSCNSLASITLPACTYLGERSFAYCENLVSVSYTYGVKVYDGNDIFSCCSSLKYVSMPNLESIGCYQLFNSCEALKNIELPKVKYLDQLTFADCSSLEYLFLPSVTQISENNPFYGCYKSKITLVVSEDATWYEPITDWFNVIIFKDGYYLSLLNNINGNTIDMSYDEDWDS